MVSMLLRRSILVLAILGTLAFTLIASVKPFFVAIRLENSNIMGFKYSGSVQCPSPPAGWDPTTATPAQLRFYGLSLPPAKSGVAYQDWVVRMRHATHHVCTPGVASHEHTDVYRSGTAGSNGDYWSGYINTNGNGPYTFYFIEAEWYVPSYSGTNNSQRALQWVGIGGYGSNNLWQAGTETDHAEGYRFWYEDVPNDNIIYAGPTVHSGDFVYVEVDYNYNVRNEAFLSMYNQNNGQYWSTQKSFVPGGNSVEWILERTSCGTSKNYALAPITNLNWSDAYEENTYSGNYVVPITNWGTLYETTMYQNGVDLSDNSGIGSDGASFTTYYHHPGTSYC
jgi:hypothetical protein